MESRTAAAVPAELKRLQALTDIALEETVRRSHSARSELAYYRARLEQLLAEREFGREMGYTWDQSDFIRHTREMIEHYNGLVNKGVR